MVIDIKKKFKIFGEKIFRILDETPLAKSPINIDYLAESSLKKIILQIDGGGILGILCAYVLYSAEYYSEKKNTFYKFVTDYFGTSVGSLVAAAIYKRLSPYTILQLLIEIGPDIFKDRSLLGKLFRKSLYRGDELEKFLDKYFGNITFKEAYEQHPLKASLNISVVSTSREKTLILNHITAPDMPIRIALRASVAAPMFFPPVVYDEEIYCDGGTGTYNCLLEKAMDMCMFDLKMDPKDYYIISLGCGKSPENPPTTRKMIEEIEDRNKIEQLMFTLMFGRQESVQKQAKKFEHLKKSMGLMGIRVDPDLPDHLSRMDKTDNIPEILDIVDRV